MSARRTFPDFNSWMFMKPSAPVRCQTTTTCSKLWYLRMPNIDRLKRRQGLWHREWCVSFYRWRAISGNFLRILLENSKIIRSSIFQRYYRKHTSILIKIIITYLLCRNFHENSVQWSKFRLTFSAFCVKFTIVESTPDANIFCPSGVTVSVKTSCVWFLKAWTTVKVFLSHNVTLPRVSPVTTVFSSA